ncbi:DegT/DnrJ/EryC1/StrS family aminotransferase [Alistipes sp. i18-0019-D1]|uniref:DegT/DnrJ/EryC1/StrS family aminotransferase n=1 Tax=Alistipes sp. i18-0019-D1 TaxID=3132707 RepID=UPI0036F32D42
MANRNIYVTMPTLAPLTEVTEILQHVWKSGVMTHNGPVLQEFERKVAAWHGLKNHVVVVNGTIALQLAIKALELKGEIITTPFSFIATTSAIMYEGCTPVYSDIDHETLNLDPAKLEEKITDKTVAIMPVHVFGNPCDIEAIDAIAKKHRLKVIYDACHAVGVTYKGRSIFAYGDVSCTSYHATKMLNSGEGGGCFTTNDALHEKMKRIRFFGFSNDKSNIAEVGSNYKMTEVHASVGLANLKYLQAALDDRKEKYMRYKDLLCAIPGLKFQKINGDCNYSYFPVILDSEATLLKVEKALNDEHIFPRRYFYPSLNTYKDLIPYAGMPVSEDIASRILCLPLYYDLTKEEVKRIASIINSTLA